MEEAEPEPPEKWEEIQINGDPWGPKRGPRGRDERMV